MLIPRNNATTVCATLFSYDNGITFFIMNLFYNICLHSVSDIAGEADFLVFMTDYSSYAGIFTCQKILFGHTKSATILSRKPTLDKAVVNQVGHDILTF